MAKNLFGPCKRAWHGSRRCQTKHWTEGSRTMVCKEPPYCATRLEGGNEPLLVQCGCTADVPPASTTWPRARPRVAAHQGAGWNDAWRYGTMCGESCAGGMPMGLACARVRRTVWRAPGDNHRQAPSTPG